MSEKIYKERQPITTAPRDGTPIIGYRDPREDECLWDYIKVIRWEDYHPDSQSGQLYLLGEGPRGHFKYVSNDASFTFKPTHWSAIAPSGKKEGSHE